ncbi:MAG: gamma-glutamyltranspeptidase [Rhodoglobus sp.]|nr:gamma-glutamyltranspeptidase [Rhodoglobus sp.]
MSRSWIAGFEPEAMRLGADLLERGWSAFDVAICASLAQGAVDPLWTSLGGFGVALVTDLGASESAALSFHARAPGGISPLAFSTGLTASVSGGTVGAFTVDGQLNQLGHLAVGTPGMAAGLDGLHREGLRRGRSRPLDQVLAPVVAFLRSGPALSQHVYRTWVSDDRPGYARPATRLHFSATGRRLYSDHGALPEPGTRLRNDDYANCLEQLGRLGFGDFYRGELADRIAQDFSDNHGYLGSADLESYAVDTTPPLRGRYREFEVEVPPLPSLGVLVLDALRLLEASDRGDSPQGPKEVRRRVDAMQRTLAGLSSLGDPEFPAESIESLERNTTHLTVLDSEGTLVSLTTSLGAASGVIVEGSGFMLNGALHRFNPTPGSPNSLRPGARRLTGISPLVLRTGSEPQLSLGGAGGVGIVQGLVQVLSNVVDFGMSPAAALAAPRFAVESGEVVLEAGVDVATVRTLSDAGFTVRVLPDALDSELVGRIVALERIGHDEWVGAADPRGGGVALSVQSERAA